MGEFDIDPQSLQYVYFMVATVINVIIMLNLLISILGDSFEAFQNEAGIADCLEMAELVIELETLMYWKREIQEKKYFQVCKFLDVAGMGEWEGKIKAIHAAVEKSRKETSEQMAKLNDKVDLMFKYVKEHLK